MKKIRNIINSALIAIGITPRCLRSNQFRGRVNGRLFCFRSQFEREIRRLSRAGQPVESEILFEIVYA